MPPVGFEPTNPAGERPQAHALDRTATGTGKVQLKADDLHCGNPREEELVCQV